MRLKVSDLLVGTEYAIQVRANDGEEVSEWSPRYLFVTARDDTQPAVPQNVTWRVSNDSYVGEWDSVDTDIKGRPVSVIRYGVRLKAGSPEHVAGEKTIILATSAASETESGRQRFDYMFQQAIDTFRRDRAQEIEFSVRAVIEGPDGPVHGDWSTPIVASNTAPEAPTNGAAKSIIDGVVLTWDASVSTDVVGYRVYFELTPNFTPSVNNLAVNNPDWTPQLGMELDMITGTEFTYHTGTYADHYFKVRAVDAYNQESADLDITGAPKSPFGTDEIPPNSPTNVIGTIETVDDVPKIKLTWDYTGPADPDEEDLAGFAIRWKSATATGPMDYWTWISSTDAAARSAEFVVPKRYAGYQVEITSFDVVGNYADPWVSVTVSGGDGINPTAPSVSTRPGENSVEFLVAEPPEDDMKDGGIWQYGVTGDGQTYNYTTGSRTLAITGLKSGTTYSYTVTPVDAEGLSGPAATGSFSTLDFPLPPGPTDGFVPAKVGTVSEPVKTVALLGAIDVRWPEVTTRSDGAAQPEESIIHYEVHASATPAFTPSGTTLVANAGGTSAQITSVGGSALVPGTDYYIQVRAKDADGVGASSDEVVGTSRTATGDEIPSISAGKIDTGTLDAAIITMGSGGVIQSSNYGASAGYKLDETGLIINDGTVSATALKGGTISGTTVNIGAGGTLNVDSTAIIKSNDYLAGSTGWKLDSAGLEINSGSISASLLTSGSINTGTIYVYSSISDAYGNWSINPQSINIYNGTISGATVVTNQLYSTSTDATTGRRLFNINNGGYAEFSGARIYGNTILGSGTTNFIQSNYFSGTSGWKIDGSGNATFGSATINAGLFRTSSGRYTSVEVGDTGSGDWVDEVRMFSSYTVASIRNPSFNPGSLYMSFAGGGGMEFGSYDGIYTRYGNHGRAKFTTGGQFQARTSTDSGYADFVARNVHASGGKLYMPSYSTTSLAANVRMTTDGTFDRLSSSRRYKTLIHPMSEDVNTETALKLSPVIFKDIRDYDERGAESPWIPGFIAEDADGLGLTPWVEYNEDGTIESFAYERWSAVQQIILQEHNEKIKTLEERVEELERKLDSV